MFTQTGNSNYKSCFIVTCAIVLMAFTAQAAPSRYVIHISVDGLRPDAITALGPQGAPNFYRFRTQGAWTDNARTDFDHTVTLPNHTSQITGRGVTGPKGHNWTANGDVPVETTLHTNKGSYVASAFDVAHDNGLRTALFTGKKKFVIYDQSYNAGTGAPDKTGADNGRDKIDLYVYKSKSDEMTDNFVTAMKARPFHYSFVHFADPDSAGHDKGWNITELESPYLKSVRQVDNCLGKLFRLIGSTPALAGKTTILLTADHGGTKTNSHGDKSHRENYTIPFYAWGAGIKAGDLYRLNPTARRDPGTGRPTYADPVQPIRNGDAANFALKLLGLPAVPGSTIGVRQDLMAGAMKSPA